MSGQDFEFSPKRVLVACERSGVVRDAFICCGHHAVSCDVVPTMSLGPHVVGDVLNLLDDGWDMMIAFPPCTDLSKAGARYFPEKIADGRVDKAVSFVKALRNAPIPRICIENPIGLLSKLLRRPTQIIQPFQFGDPYIKSTCLWLYNLPRLVPSNVVEPSKGHWVDGGHGGLHRDPVKRALTFPGVALAMARQWGSL